MYKLLIVDDEPLVQVGIKSMLDWSAMDVEVCGTAANGEAALKIIEEQSPDIVITDIKMPILNGLDLVKICRERFGKLPAFIILTSYEEFDMARAAISYQVIDYLVKLELNADSLRESMQRALDFVKNNQTAAPKNDEFVMTSSALLTERFFVKLVNNLFAGEEEFLLQKNELSLTFSAHGCTIGYFEISSPNEGTMENEKLMNLYSSTLQMFLQLIVKYIDCQVVSLDVRHFMIMFQCPSTSATDNRSAILNAIENTCKMLKNYYNISIRAGIGRITMQPFELSDSYYDARQMLARTSENEPFCFYDELPDNETVKNIFNMAIFKDDIRAAYEEMNHEKLRSIFASITELFTLYPSHYIQAMDAAGSILYLTISLLPVGEKIVCDIFADDADNYRSLYKQTSTEQIVGWMNKLCDGLCAFFISQKKDYKNHIVSNVKSYIHENLDKKLSLNEVAAAFGISPAYLSSLFGKYSDMGFVDYVNSAKIQEAKDMLQSSNDKIYEIADKLGFESAFYFSKVFKKVEGCSPREYLSRF